MATQAATTPTKASNAPSNAKPSSVLPPATNIATAPTAPRTPAITPNANETGSNVDVSLSQPNPPLDTQTASQKSEEKENGLMAGLGKLGRNGMTPWLLMGGLALAAALGAPMWLVVVGGLLGWAAIAASRNGDDKPNHPSNGDIPLGNQRDPRQQGRGLDIAIDPLNQPNINQPNIDIPIGSIPNNGSIDIPLNGSLSNNQPCNNPDVNIGNVPTIQNAVPQPNGACQVPASMLMTVPTNIPPLNGVQYSGDTNGVVSTPTCPNNPQQNNGLNLCY